MIDVFIYSEIIIIEIIIMEIIIIIIYSIYLILSSVPPGSHYYRLNDRLYASPVWKDARGKSVCVDCKTPRDERRPANVSFVASELVADQVEDSARKRTPARRGFRKAPLAWGSQRRFKKPPTRVSS
jgi:hypothetical protein